MKQPKKKQNRRRRDEKIVQFCTNEYGTHHLEDTYTIFVVTQRSQHAFPDQSEHRMADRA